MPINLRTMWPALIFAASRNDKVMGRTAILVDSISTRKGLSQSGAPSGSKCAIVALVLYVVLDIIRDIHRGKPNDKVKIRCLDVLNAYGTSPRRLTVMMQPNSDVTMGVNPFRFLAVVRCNWENMTSRIGALIASLRVLSPPRVVRA